MRITNLARRTLSALGIACALASCTTTNVHAQDASTGLRLADSQLTDSHLTDSHSADSQITGTPLIGTWIFKISLEDCTSGARLGLPFQSILTFNQGGTVAENTSNPMFYPLQRGPGQGVWESAGPGVYKAATTAFITNNGALARIQTITQTIELTSDNTLKTTVAGVKFFAPNGKLLATACAAASGKRFQLNE